jgi:acyl-CoA thioesterase FadM
MVSGLLRNLITFIQALFVRGSLSPRSSVASHFRITPFDCGLKVLKSDKYLQLAEAAQLDFLVRTGLVKKLLRSRVGFVNAAMLIRFGRPIGMFRRVRVETQIVHADERCAWFSHTLAVGELKHAEVLVKMKFKRGSITVPPAEFIDGAFGPKPAHLQQWDQTLEAL